MKTSSFETLVDAFEDSRSGGRARQHGLNDAVRLTLADVHDHVDTQEKPDWKVDGYRMRARLTVLTQRESEALETLIDAATEYASPRPMPSRPWRLEDLGRVSPRALYEEELKENLVRAAMAFWTAQREEAERLGKG